MSSNKSGRTTLALLNSARTLFLEKGYEHTPVDEICALAGVAKGTFFYHFETKQYMVRYLLEKQIMEFKQKMLYAMRDCEDAIDKIIIFINELFNLQAPGPEANKYFEDAIAAEWFFRVIDETREELLYPVLRSIVSEGIKEKLFFVNNTDSVTQILFLGINQYMHNYIKASSGYVEKLAIFSGIQEVVEKTLGIKKGVLGI